MPPPENRAVFLSYASQDVEAARRLCEALRAAGVEVWFDQSELVGGDAWDAKIRKQIAECALFVPVISASTQERLEGYFRIEWKLAAQRTHAMAEEKAFLLPVVIDGTRDTEAKVPAEFRAVQWTRLPGGEVPPAFVARVRSLLGGSVAQASSPTVQNNAGGTPALHKVGRRVPAAAWGIAMLAILVVAAIGWQRMRRPTESTPLAASNAGAGTHSLRSGQAQSPPTSEKSSTAVVSDKSVAVLPFANLSGDKEQEYFSDGLTEEVLGALRRERDLTVPGNTSCFSFKGKTVAATEIARTLNVSRLVEGSVQRVGSRVRIRVTLARPADNSSEELGTFTEELTDIFALQEKVASAVVAKLTRRATTVPVAVLTKNPAAYDAYLRGRAAQARGGPRRGESIRFLEQAVALDPAFALAWASLAEAKFARYARGLNRSAELADETRVLIDRALGLQPSLPEALIVRADWERQVKADFAAAQRDLDRAETLQPATAGLRFIQALVAKDLGKWEEAVRLSRDMVGLDPNNSDYAAVHATQIFWRKGEYAEADQLFSHGDASRDRDYSNRINLRLVWRGPEPALRLLDRISKENKAVRIDLLQAMDRRREIPALAAEVESDVIEALTERPESPPPYWALKRLVACGRADAARRLALAIRARVTKEFEEGNRTPFQRGAFIHTEIVLGRRDAALAALEEWRRENQLVQNSYRRVTEFGDNAAPLYALLGRADEAIAVLREYAAIRLQVTLSLRYDSDFAPIRNDPRFQELMKQQEAWAKAQPDPVDL